MRRAAGGGFDLLGGDGIFTNYSKGSAVVINLRINSILMSIGGHSVGVGKKCLLAGGPVGRQRSRVLSEGPADAETKFAQRLDAGLEERLEEKAARNVFALIGRVRVVASTINRAVEDADGVIDRGVEEAVVEFDPQIVVGSELGRETGFDEEQFRAGLKPLQTDRRLELARLDLELRPKPCIHKGVVQKCIVPG